LAKVLHEQEKKASNLINALRNSKKMAARAATPTEQSPSKSKKMILKTELPQLPLPSPPKQREKLSRQHSKGTAEQDIKNKAELAEGLAAVPQEKKAEFWRVFGEKVETETKISGLKQKLNTLKSKLGALKKQG
jgi:hypothetical protein